VICELADHFFRHGSEETVELSVLRVERRKPFRSRPRAAINELCLLRLTSRQAERDGKLVDVSTAGVGIITDRSFEPGERLEIASHIGPDALHCTVTALHTQPAGFGRHRTGCRIDAIDEAGRRLIDHLVRTRGQLQSDPSHRRTGIPRAA
jgi:PilZ domain